MTDIHYIGNNHQNTKRLFLFPETPSDANGYTIAVREDFKRFEFDKEDLVIVWTLFFDESILFFENLHRDINLNVLIIKRRRDWFYRLKSILLFRHPSMFYSKSIAGLVERVYQLEYVFCGDTTFFLFADNIKGDFVREVRFHNIWMKIHNRLQIMPQAIVGSVMRMNLFFFNSLEKRIFKANVNKIFINQSDLTFYEVMTGDTGSKIWSVIDDICRRDVVHDEVLFNDDGSLQIIWFGSVSGHMEGGLKWFIKHVYIPLMDDGLNLRFDLYGEGSLKFNSKKYRITGHGRVVDSGLPMGGKGLFINPDLIGGGIKLKIKYFIEYNLRFLSTSFGMEGYEAVDTGNRALISPPNEWLRVLRTLFDCG